MIVLPTEPESPTLLLKPEGMVGPLLVTVVDPYGSTLSPVH